MKTEHFQNPDEFFRGTDFWMMNGELTEEGIEKQLREMKEKGVYSFIARTYIGLKSDYPGEKFKSKMHFMVDTAKKLGLKIFFQAGYMPEAVPVLKKEHTLRNIIPVKENEVGERRVFCRHGDWFFVEQIADNFLDMFDSDAMDHYLKVSYEDMWSEFEDEYGKTIISVWVDEPSYSWLYLPYPPKLEELFEKTFGYSLEENIWKLYLDGEGAETLRYHYRTLMRDLLEESYFKKVKSWCNAHGLLFSGHLMLEDRLLTQILRAQACMPYYRYLDVPGMDVLRAEMNWATDPIHSGLGINKNFEFFCTPIQCVSACNQAGKKHILAEMYGVGGENFNFRNMTHMFDAFASTGINHRSVHGAFYTLKGRGKRAYPPHINYYQPFWPKYKNVTDYCARVSAFITEGKPNADIVLINPLETAYMLFHGVIGESKAGGAELEMLDNEITDLLSALKCGHFEAEYADLASLRDMGRIEKGKFCVGEMSYGTVVLPKLKVITTNLLELLEKYYAEGGKIFIYGNIPTMLDGVYDPSLKARLETISTFCKSLSDLLFELPTPSYGIEGSGAENVFVNHRICDGGDKFMLYNHDCSRDADITFSAKGKGKLYSYDGYSGKVYSLPCETCGDVITSKLRIPAGGSMLISIESFNEYACEFPEKKDIISLQPVSDKWEVTPLHENVLYLDFCRYRKGDGEFSEVMPVLAVQNILSREEYRGKVTLQFEFEAAEDISSLCLALEDSGLQKITVDGKEISNEKIGYYWDDAFEKVSVGDICKGKHILELSRDFYPLTKVTNDLTQLFETRYGVELEPVYLLGKFVARGNKNVSIVGGSVYEPGFKLYNMPEKILTCGELTTEGFPFYVGEMILSQNVNVGEGVDLSETFLKIDIMNSGCAEVFVNGINVGDINRAPCKLALDGALRHGSNLIEIKLYSTLYNIVGPFHRPQGNVGDTFGGGYNNPDAAWLSLDTTVDGWEIKRSLFYPSWTDQYNVVPFGIDGISLLF